MAGAVVDEVAGPGASVAATEFEPDRSELLFVTPPASVHEAAMSAALTSKTPPPLRTGAAYNHRESQRRPQRVVRHLIHVADQPGSLRERRKNSRSAQCPEGRPVRDWLYGAWSMSRKPLADDVTKPTYFEPIAWMVIGVGVLWVTGAYRTSYVVLSVPLVLVILRMILAIFRERQRRPQPGPPG